MQFVEYQRARRQALPTILGILTITIGALGLVGWIIQSSLLTSIDPSYVSMKPNTAVGLILLGTAALLMGLRTDGNITQQVSAWISGTVVLLGFITLAQYTLGANFGVDQLLFQDSVSNPDTWSPGRMAAITCFAFIISGIALHCKASNYVRVRHLPDLLAVTTSLLAIFVLLGYLYDADTLRRLGMHGGMAVNTATAFLLLSSATLLLRSDTGLFAPMLRGRPARAFVVWFLPSVVIGPALLGWLRQHGEAAGFYGHADGIALEVVLTIMALVVLTLCAAHAVNRANEKLAAAESAANRFFKLSNDLQCISGTKGYFLQVNAAWERVLGYTTTELTARPFLEFVHPDDVLPTESEYSRQAAGNDVVSFENRYRCQDGTYRTLLWNATQPDDNGHIYASAHDITERKGAEERIRQLNDALACHARDLEAINNELESFSYSVSHDLRAPLRSIDGFSQALLEDYNDRLDAQGQDFLRRVRASSQRMGQLIDDMLQLSRVTRSEFGRQEVDLSQMALAIFSELREKHPNRLAIIEIEDGLIESCDPRLMRIALENLFENSWKYSSARDLAHIRFGRTARSPQSVYAVCDDGVGFDATYAGKLFTPFQRLHRQDEFEGTGIGLATVRRVILRHGGAVWAEGTEGKGATFYFTLGQNSEQGDEHVPEDHSIGRRQSRRRAADASCT